MDQQTMKATEAKCTQEAMPKCRAKCPLHIDVRAFIENIAQNKLAEAKKTLEKYLPVPNILAHICDHPCESVCLRKDYGGSIAISKLEVSCIEYDKIPVKILPRSKKSEHIAILGHGLAAFVVAYELARKAYPITIFYEHSPESYLLEKFKNLTKENIQLELDFLAKQGVIFSQTEFNNTLLDKVKKDYSAVFIDADSAANIATLYPQVDNLTCLAENNICLGGFLETSPIGESGEKYTSSSKQAAEGKRSAITIERLLTGVSISAERDLELVRETKLFTPLDDVQYSEKVLSQNKIYSLEEANKEALRCLPCQCLACVKECVYLQKYGSYPKVYTRQISNNSTIVKGQHLANPIINGCALCGQCTEICPERFSMAEMCLSARQDMVKRSYMPPSAFEFALEDMANAIEHSFLLAPANIEYVFFPGCQLIAAKPEQVFASYNYLQNEIMKQKIGLYASCCTIPAHWAGEEDKFLTHIQDIQHKLENLGNITLITACANCYKIFTEYLPNIKIISLWDLLDAHISTLPQVKQTYTIHDPCAARYNKKWQDSVRSLAKKAGIKLDEPRLTANKTACCGYGGLVWSSQANLAKDMAKHRVEELEYPALVSCIMCKDNFVKNNKETIYLLDILPIASKNQNLNSSLSLSQKRYNRAKFKEQFLENKTDFVPIKAEHIVEISPKLLEIIEAKHILITDVEQAILSAEKDNMRFLEQISGHYVASFRPRNVTFWVRYSKISENKYILHDAWAHRFKLEDLGK